MKIDQQNLIAAHQAAARALDVGAAASSSAKNSVSAQDGGDRVELSGISRIIQSVQSQRTAQLDRLRGLVRNGQYSADPALTSRSIVNDSLANAALQSQGAA